MLAYQVPNGLSKAAGYAFTITFDVDDPMPWQMAVHVYRTLDHCLVGARLDLSVVLRGSLSRSVRAALSTSTYPGSMCGFAGEPLVARLLTADRHLMDRLSQLSRTQMHTPFHIVKLPASASLEPHPRGALFRLRTMPELTELAVAPTFQAAEFLSIAARIEAKLALASRAA